ncbi:Rne/Rng family ribonuclease [Saprospiraceae bacterium]|nr:Rne/Rng family ribonuclease [Saprospiraceae bacterium]
MGKNIYVVSKELIISTSPTEVEIALIENAKLIEIHTEKTKDTFAVGDIFLGSIRKMMPGLNAAFVDIGHRKDAFLHYTDLGPQIKSLAKYTKTVQNGKINTQRLDNFQNESDNPKGGKIDNVFTKHEHVLVQILKEPISTKGPRLSCEITVPGRFIVLTPFTEIIAISKKITDPEERKRLKLLIGSIKPKNFGVIVRTAAQGKQVADLHSEISELNEKWKEIYQQLRNTKKPKKLLSELGKTTTIIRDILTDDFTSIITDDKDVYNDLKGYLKSIDADKVKILKHFTGARSIFDEFGVTKQIKASFGKNSTMSSGAYIVLESTEAMHVIDVNSGPKMVKRSQEDAAMAVNMESAEEIARQLRLRDIGGLIIIDFIDVRKSEHKTRLFQAMKKYMEGDRAQHTILPLSKFGLMQITRQRVRPEVKIDTSEQCPVCIGTGKSTPSLLVTDSIERDINFILDTRPTSKIKLETHPFVYAYIKQGLPSLRMRWWMEYKKWITVAQNNNYDLFQYKFYDEANDEIRMEG